MDGQLLIDLCCPPFFFTCRRRCGYRVPRAGNEVRGTGSGGVPGRLHQDWIDPYRTDTSKQLVYVPYDGAVGAPPHRCCAIFTGHQRLFHQNTSGPLWGRRFAPLPRMA